MSFSRDTYPLYRPSRVHVLHGARLYLHQGCGGTTGGMATQLPLFRCHGRLHFHRRVLVLQEVVVGGEVP